MMRLVVVLAFAFCDAAAAATASGRHWSIAPGTVTCGQPLVTVGARIRYRGPPGAVEAPVVQLVDRDGKARPPKSVAWKEGGKPLAEWLSTGGLCNIKPEVLGEVDLRFEVAAARRPLRLEFGDVDAFAVCPKQADLPRPPQAQKVKANVFVHRGRYPCRAGRTIEAEYPPHLPRQLLVFGRGYLPNARAIELPMGRAPAQSYAFSGPDDLNTVEEAARRAIGEHFPQYAGRGYFAFNWGVQRSQSGNEIYSIGIYELRSCP